MTKRLAAALLALAMTAACGPPGDPERARGPIEENARPSPIASAPAAPAGRVAALDDTAAPAAAGDILYACDDGRAVSLRYEADGALMAIGGRTIRFHRWPAGGGYATEDGLRDGHGLYWRVENGAARLYENALDDGFRPGDEMLLTRCRRTP